MALDICQESLNLIDQNKQLSIDRILFLAHKKDLDSIFIANQIKGRIKCAQKMLSNDVFMVQNTQKIFFYFYIFFYQNFVFCIRFVGFGHLNKYFI